jgi:ActR/RegA family two-component response regulator
VVEKLREFDKDIRIILLTGHSDYIIDIGALKDMDIQLYIEKGPLVLGEITGEILDLSKFEVPET